MDIFDAFATDPKLESEGAWFPCGDGKLLIARADNRRFGKLLNKLVEQNKPALDLEDDAADDLSEKLMGKAIANTILLGWAGISYQKQPVTYSPEQAEKLLAHKDFRSFVMARARDIEGYKFKEEAAQGKA